MVAVGARVVYVAFDADEPGNDYADRVIPALRAAGLRALRVPIAEGRDLAECLADAENRTWWLADSLLTAEAMAGDEPAHGDALILPTPRAPMEVAREFARSRYMSAPRAMDVLRR